MFLEYQVLEKWKATSILFYIFVIVYYYKSNVCQCFRK